MNINLVDWISSPLSKTRGALLIAALGMPMMVAGLEIEAKLLQATPTPTLQQIAPYPRALCTYLYEVEKVHRGTYHDNKILVVKWAVWNREQVIGLPSKTGAVEKLKLDRWIDYPDFNRERIVDAIGDVDRVIYYDVESRPEGARAAAIATTLKTALEGRAKELESGVVRGTARGWLFLAEELRHAQSGRFWESDWTEVSRAGVDPLPVMLDFQRRLKELGVALWILPVPTKVSIHPDQLKPGLTLESQTGYLDLMSRAGLKVIDLQEQLQAQDPAQSGGQLWYLPQDSHWQPRTCRLAARLLAGHLDHHVAKDDRSQFLLGPPSEMNLRGDLARMAPEGKLPPDQVGGLPVYRLDAEKPGVGLSHPESPFVLVGDSHVTVFSEGTEEMHGAGLGLPDYLAYHLGLPVDVIASHGDGVHQARINLYQQRSINPKYPGYWKNKKAVIWVFAARNFTRADRWSAKIPVMRRQ